MWRTREKLVRLSGVYSAWIVRSILKNSFSGYSEVAGALGGKGSETMCEGERVTGTARRDFCDPGSCWEGGEDEPVGDGPLLIDAQDQGKKEKSRGGAKKRENSE